jgi:hypothetical protein
MRPQPFSALLGSHEIALLSGELRLVDFMRHSAASFKRRIIDLN